MRALAPIAAILVSLTMAACARSQPPAQAQPVFKPEAWFVGHMRSTGRLKAILRKPLGLAVESQGRRLPDGSLRLDQAIHWAGGAVDHRFWIMRPQGGGYAVTLSDARGPVMFETTGARAHLRYRDRRGPTIEQWMDLQPDGRTLANRGVLSILGLPIAHLDETIVHDPS